MIAHITLTTQQTHKCTARHIVSSVTQEEHSGLSVPHVQLRTISWRGQASRSLRSLCAPVTQEEWRRSAANTCKNVAAFPFIGDCTLPLLSARGRGLHEAVHMARIVHVVFGSASCPGWPLGEKTRFGPSARLSRRIGNTDLENGFLAIPSSCLGCRCVGGYPSIASCSVKWWLD